MEELRFINNFPKQLRDPAYRFIKLKGRTKFPLEKGWQSGRIFAWDDPELQKYPAEGNNVGVLGGYGDLCIIDADMPILVNVIKRKLPRTFTVKSPHGMGIHCHYKWTGGEKKSYVLYDTIEANGKRPNIGNVRGVSGMVVCPGCFVYDCPKCGAHDDKIEVEKNGYIHCKNEKCGYEGEGKPVYYTIEDNTEIAGITTKIIVKNLRKFLSEKDLKKESQKGTGDQKIVFTRKDIQSIYDIIPNNYLLIPDGSGFRGPHPVPHGDDKGRDDYFVVDIGKNLWHCFVDNTGGGIFELIAVIWGILKCEDCGRGTLRGEDFKKAVKIAKEHYGIILKSDEKRGKKGEGQVVQNQLRKRNRLRRNRLKASWEYMSTCRYAVNGSILKMTAT